MKFAQKIGLAAVAGILGLSAVSLAAPSSAHASDSSWGCGGWCKGARP
ncbi:hypothetical protein BH11ACT8_BH11ACT8_09840 [soil metagenome]